MSRRRSMDNIATTKPNKVQKREIDVLLDRQRERKHLVQYLNSAVKEHEDGLAVPDYNIQKESTLYMMLRVGRGMHILVKTLADTTLVLKVELSDTIHDVKEKIQDMERIPTWEQWYVIRGKTLEDGRTLASYGVEKGSTLFLVVWSYLLGTNVVGSGYLAYVAYLRENSSSMVRGILGPYY